jgi:surfeit locus 1 family protein
VNDTVTHRAWRAPFWAWAGYLPLIALLATLGVWQAQRGLGKQVLAEAEAATPEAVTWQPSLPARLAPTVLAEVQGRYLPGRWLLLDNQTFNRRPGYHLWSLFESDSGASLVVNRGWVPLHRERDRLPEFVFPSEPQTLRGYWRPLPQAGWSTSPPAACTAATLPIIVQYPDIQTLRCITGEPLAEGVLLLLPDPQDPIGQREWSLTAGVPATRHFGYAAQWFTFALVLTYFFVTLNFRTRSHD